MLLSTAEAEYIAAGSCCAHILWLKQQLEDFGLQISKVPLMCDNTSAINDENQIKEAFINGGRGHPPSHLKFFLLVFSKLKEDIK